MYDIRSAMLNIGIVFTPGKFKINLEKTWKTPGILVNLRSTDPVDKMFEFDNTEIYVFENFLIPSRVNESTLICYKRQIVLIFTEKQLLVTVIIDFELVAHRRPAH